MYVWPENSEELCYQDLLIYRLLRILNRLISTITFRFEQKNNMLQILPRLSSPEAHNVIGRSWLDKLLKSKVDWFISPTGWLPVPLPYPECSSIVRKDRSSRSIAQSFNQSDPHWRQGSRTCKNIHQLQPNHFWNDHRRRPASKFRGLHLYSTLSTFLSPSPQSIYAQRRAGRILCVLQHLFNTCHSFNLCRGWTRWRERTLSCALVCLREKIQFFSGDVMWRSLTLDALKKLQWSTPRCISYPNPTRAGIWTGTLGRVP